MATWQDIITSALVEIGVLVNGEDPETKDLDQGLTYVRQMMEDWQLRGLLVPGRSRFSHTVATDSTEFTIGEDGDIDRGVPVRIRDIRFCRAGSDHQYRLQKTSDETLVSSASPGSGGPTTYVFDNSHPLGKIIFNRLAESGDSFFVVAEGTLVENDFGLSDDLSFPFGYERAIRLNLAIELAAPYGVKGDQLAKSTVALAGRAINDIRKMNLRPINSRPDHGLIRTRKNFMRYHHHR